MKYWPIVLGILGGCATTPTIIPLAGESYRPLPSSPAVIEADAWHIVNDVDEQCFCYALVQGDDLLNRVRQNYSATCLEEGKGEPHSLDSLVVIKGSDLAIAYSIYDLR
jgi:hypothetical protein